MSCAPTHLTCEYLIDPIGIDEPRPRLAWRISDPQQTAYQIVVDDVWDSGKVESDQSVHVEYAGPLSQPGQRLIWRVRIWIQDGDESPYSEPAFWEAGLIGNDQWQARWIGPDVPQEAKAYTDCRYLRRTFDAPAEISRARLYIAARGVYEATINNAPVTDDVLGGGFTTAHQRIQYRAFDVTDRLSKGENTLDVALTGGWYCGWIVKNTRPDIYGDRPALIARLEIEFADGSRDVIVTDESWRIGRGPVTMADLYMGENYDARREVGEWEAPHVEPMDDVPLSAYRMQPIRRVREIRPQTVTEVAPGAFIYDLGQNMSSYRVVVALP